MRPSEPSQDQPNDQRRGPSKRLYTGILSWRWTTASPRRQGRRLSWNAVFFRLCLFLCLRGVGGGRKAMGEIYLPFWASCQLELLECLTDFKVKFVCMNTPTLYLYTCDDVCATHVYSPSSLARSSVKEEGALTTSNQSVSRPLELSSLEPCRCCRRVEVEMTCFVLSQRSEQAELYLYVGTVLYSYIHVCTS